MLEIGLRDMYEFAAKENIISGEELGKAKTLINNANWKQPPQPRIKKTKDRE